MRGLRRWGGRLLLATLSLVASATKAQTVWTAGTGNWFTPANWTLGVPDPMSSTAFDAIVSNGGTAQIQAAGASVRRLRIGVTAAGSMLINGGSLNVTENLHVNEGVAGVSSVSVIGGSTVSSPSTIVGFNSGANSSFLISGSGTTFNAATQFIVGNLGAGTATLTVESGGALLSGTGAIAGGMNPTGAPGTAVVRNPGSTWSTTGALFVGNPGVGTLTIEDQGLVHVGTNLSINSASSVNVNGGKLRFNTIGGTGGLSRLFFNSGTIQLAGNRSLTTDATVTTLFGAVPAIPSGKALTIEGTTTIARAGSGPIINGTLTSLSSGLVIGSFAGPNLRVSGAGAAWNVSGGLSIGDFEGTSGSLQIDSGGTVTSNFAELGNNAGAVNASANVTVTGAGSSWTTTGNFTVGELGALGSLAITSGGLVDVGGTLSLAGNGFVTLSGGTLRFNGFSAATFANFNYQSGTIRLIGNRTVGSDSAISSFFGSPAVIPIGKGLTIDGTTTIASSLTLDGGTLSVGNLVNNGTLKLLSGTLAVTQAGANVDSPIVTTNLTTINIGANNVAIGRAASFEGFIHHGPLHIGANSVTLHSAGYARLGTIATLAGGTINAPNGVTLPAASNLVGAGSVAARLTGELGSVIEASGALALGDGMSPAGFNFAGELRTRQHAVTVNSSAQAALGNLTTLGSGAMPGTLVAANGITVDFGGAITGFGTISSTNTLAKRSVVNGVAQGNSIAQPLTFTGYVKGAGTFDKVNFSGTFDPGLSPALTTVGSIILASTNTLIMELGGTSRGDEYDAILASGSLGFGGTLAVTLINGFTPDIGNTFDLFDWSSMSGTFATLQLPPLLGLAWDTSQLYSSGVLSVVAAPGVSGDYNDDGDVDAADYVTWRKLNGTSTVMPNDPNPLPIDGDQYATWRLNFGESGGAGGGVAGGSDGVPEPSAFLLLFSAVIGRMALWSRRNSGSMSVRDVRRE